MKYEYGMPSKRLILQGPSSAPGNCHIFLYIPKCPGFIYIVRNLLYFRLSRYKEPLQCISRVFELIPMRSDEEKENRCKECISNMRPKSAIIFPLWENLSPLLNGPTGLGNGFVTWNCGVSIYVSVRAKVNVGYKMAERLLEQYQSSGVVLGRYSFRCRIHFSQKFYSEFAGMF